VWRMSAAQESSSQSSGGEVPRPRQVTFTVAMLCAAGGLHLLLAVAEFTTSGVITIVIAGPSFGPHWLRGVLDLAFAASFFSAGFQVWSGRPLGRIQGLVVAAASVLRWALHFSASPVVSAIAIMVALLIIASLWTSSEYFRSNIQVADRAPNRGEP
jgi:hypothetical protein